MLSWFSIFLFWISAFDSSSDASNASSILSAASLSYLNSISWVNVHMISSISSSSDKISFFTQFISQYISLISSWDKCSASSNKALSSIAIASSCALTVITKFLILVSSSSIQA